MAILAFDMSRRLCRGGGQAGCPRVVRIIARLPAALRREATECRIDSASDLNLNLSPSPSPSLDPNPIRVSDARPR